MGILRKLKSALGLDGSGSEPRDRSGDGDVTVEHDPDTETEAAVKGTADEPDDPAATGTDPAGSTASTAEKPPEVPGDDDVAAEPADAAGPPSQGAEPTPSDDEGAPTDDVPDSSGRDEDVQTVSGIGPAYAARLGEAGVETVGDLLAADVATIAEASGISETRIERWQDRARDA